ncbi:MAG: hypothetical protein C0483_02445 [Pirellula sp.]|nr:hypothetical protein [Pirellula sp.]
MTTPESRATDESAHCRALGEFRIGRSAQQMRNTAQADASNGTWRAVNGELLDFRPFSAVRSQPSAFAVGPFLSLPPPAKLN